MDEEEGDRTLAHRFRHERDGRVTLRSEDHTYLDTETGDAFTSVTRMVYADAPPFDADQVLRGMMVRGTYRVRYGDKDPEQVKKEWSDSGERARTLGTRLHALLEEWMNGTLPVHPPDDLQDEWSAFQGWKEHHAHWTPYRAEWVVFCKKARLAGTLDALFWDTQKQGYVLCDWKRVKDLPSASLDAPWARLDPRDQDNPDVPLPNAPYWRYALQLSCYQALIKRHFRLPMDPLARIPTVSGGVIHQMVLVCFLSGTSRVSTLSMPYLERRSMALIEGMIRKKKRTSLLLPEGKKKKQRVSPH